MTKQKVMTLWTVIISTFIALFSALGLTSPATAATPAQQTEKTQPAAAVSAPPLRRSARTGRSSGPCHRR